jgi:phospholipid/cholesterol/gamma-HCH transport system substrate-binding protein
MSNQINMSYNFKLGIFIALGISLFVAGVYYIGKRQQLFHQTFHISGVFKDVGGLQVGNNVRFAGINVGVIENIRLLTDTTVCVDMQIDEKVRAFMKKNVKAIVGSDGLMGNKILLILPGQVGAKMLANNDTVATAQPLNMDDILLKVKLTGDNAASITKDLAVIMKSIREGHGTIGKLLMDKNFAKNVDQSMVNIKQGSDGFNQNMNAAKHNFLFRGFFKKKKDQKKMNKE